MRHIVGLSGGKDSTAMALRLAEVEPREYTYICTPTGNEPPGLFVHLANMECLLGAPVIRLGQHTLEGLMDEQSCLPSHRMRWCTRRLKILPTIEFLKQAESILYVGLRADEETREGIYSDTVTSDFPLRRWGWKESDVRDYLHHRSVTVPERTDCEWCYDQSLKDWRRLWRDRPESYRAAMEWEERTGHTFRSPQRDTQPVRLGDLGAKFAAGFLPRGDSDQIALFERPELRKCRVCTL